MSDSAEASSMQQSASAARLARVSFQTGRASSDIDPSETRDTLPDYESAPPTQHELNGQDDTEPEVREYRASLEGKRERRPTKASCLICFSGEPPLQVPNTGTCDLDKHRSGESVEP